MNSLTAGACTWGSDIESCGSGTSIEMSSSSSSSTSLRSRRGLLAGLVSLVGAEDMTGCVVQGSVEVLTH